MKFKPTQLKDAFLVELEPRKDNRGAFTRLFCENELSEIGFKGHMVQVNHSLTKRKGTLRGLHFQLDPSSEVKLLRVISGEIYDVIVDLRLGSPTYMNWIANRLSKDSNQALYIPKGFAHGFQTLTDDVEVIYHHSEFYNQRCESGIRYDDPQLNISWPLEVIEISERDMRLPFCNAKNPMEI